MSFTPGPLALVEKYDIGGAPVAVVVKPGRSVVAEFYGQRRKGNAALFVHAEELLALVEQGRQLGAYSDYDNEVLAGFRAECATAANKARGTF